MARIRLLTRWRRYAAGDDVELDDYIATTLIDNGVAEPFDAAQDGPECMAVEAPERAVQRRPRPRRRKKGTT